MTVAICDDCKEDIDRLLKSISLHSKYKNFDIEIYTSSKLLLNHILNGKLFDLIFLDVEMPEMNGISLGKRIRRCLSKCFIVFTSNYPQYALEAYDCEAYHYLIKPIKTEKLFDILNKLTKKCRYRYNDYQIQGRFENKRIHIRDILYIEYYKKHVNFYLDTPTKEHYEVTGSLTEVYENLKTFGFFRCHQAFIVNLEKISRFDGYNAILVTGDIIPISVRNKTNLIIAYANYFEGIL